MPPWCARSGDTRLHRTPGLAFVDSSVLRLQPVASPPRRASGRSRSSSAGAPPSTRRPQWPRDEESHLLHDLPGFSDGGGDSQRLTPRRRVGLAWGGGGQSRIGYGGIPDERADLNRRRGSVPCGTMQATRRHINTGGRITGRAGVHRLHRRVVPRAPAQLIQVLPTAIAPGRSVGLEPAWQLRSPGDDHRQLTIPGGKIAEHERAAGASRELVDMRDYGLPGPLKLCRSGGLRGWPLEVAVPARDARFPCAPRRA